MNYLKQLFLTSAQEWQIPVKVAHFLFWTPFILTVVILLTRLDKDLFTYLLEVEGPIEWIGVLFFLGSVILGAMIAVNRFRAGHSVQGWLFIGFTLAMIFAAGEESAWGQQLIGYDTPEALVDINYKGELSLHNIDGMQGITNVVMMLVGLYGTISFWVNQKFNLGRLGDQVDYLFFPPIFLTSYFVMLFLFRVMRFIITTESNFTLNRLPEWLEMVGAAGIFIFAWIVYRRLQRQKSQVSVDEFTLSEQTG